MTIEKPKLQKHEKRTAKATKKSVILSEVEGSLTDRSRLLKSTTAR